jgi:hypothetical protein
MSPCIGFVMGRLDKQGRFAPMVANQWFWQPVAHGLCWGSVAEHDSPSCVSLLAISR